MTLSDATPAYRGYRRQILYTLNRLLDHDAEGKAFQLEGSGDLDVYDADGILIEVAQVKDFTTPLVLSDLASKGAGTGSFVHRAVPLVRLQPIPRLSVVSFGPIGPELFDALQGEKTRRTDVVNKLVDVYDISPEAAGALIEAARPVLVHEDDLHESVIAFLRDSVAGVDPESAFDLLSQWLYGCAERKHRLTRQQVIERILGVGRFVSSRGAHHEVWFSAIEPIEEQAPSTEVRNSLADEFYRGVGTRYAHILADLDAPRPERLAEIEAAFAERDAVVLHAASGQGKTTLGYRYLREVLSDAWRFRVCGVEGRAHAQQIALALEGYADALAVPIAVFIDVSPNDLGWPELVERLARYPHIRVLVAVREEDWRRATFSNTDSIRDLDLTFDKTEAQCLFQSLSATHAPTVFLDFDEAWDRFGGQGPLLEFVYLITQGGLLRERLVAQVNRLEDEANDNSPSAATKLELLKLVAVASAYGGRIRVSDITKLLKVPSLNREIELLANEFLIRRAENGALLEGLHPIRSEILADLLTDPQTSAWAEVAATDLRLLDERDVGGFLLHCFSRRPGQVGQLLDAIASYYPSGWVSAVGVLRALLWLGLHEYAEANRKLIDDARRDSGSGWTVVLDTDIADVIPGIGSSVLEMISNVVSDERRGQIKALRARQTPKDAAFVRAITWLGSRVEAPSIPSSIEEWAAAAEVVFWARRFQVSWPTMAWLPLDRIMEATKELPLDVQADVVVGLVDGDPREAEWLETHREALWERFQRETTSPVVDDDGMRVTAHFIVDPENLSAESTNAVAVPFLDARNPLHNAALVRVDLLRRLFPNRELYACQGYGHRTGLFELPTDDTRKSGIPRDKLPLRWLTSVNALFGGIVDYEARPADWADYAARVIEVREEVRRCLEDLRKAVPVYLGSVTSRSILGGLISSEDWFRRWTVLRDPPRLPCCAVDEWGFVSELQSDVASKQASVHSRTGIDNIPTVRPYKPLLEALRTYTFAWHNFLSHAPKVMTANAGLRERASNGRWGRSDNRALQTTVMDARRLSLNQLAEAWKALPDLQRQYRLLLGTFVDAKRLEDLERRETELFTAVWPMWYAFAIHPEHRLDDPIRDSGSLVTSTNRHLDKALHRELTSLRLDGVRASASSSRVLWEGEPVLWITVDGSDGVAVYDALLPVLEAVRRSVHQLKDSPLRLYALDFRWRSVVVVPLVDAKSLAGKAWRVQTNLLMQASNAEALGFWHFLQHQVPTDALGGLGLSIWNDSRFTPGVELAETVARLWQLVVHVQDLANLPELHGIGEEIGLRYVEQIFERVQLLLQQTVDAAAVLADAITDRLWGAPQSSAHLVVANEALQALFAAALPADNPQGRARLTLKVHEFAPWATQLQEAVRYGLVAQLAWSSAVLAAPQEQG